MAQKTRQIHVGPVAVGGGARIAVQSMTNTDTRDAAATLKQIGALADAGCDIVRCAVPDMEAARALETICAGSPIPVVADIHFDYRLALEAARTGGTATAVLNGANEAAVGQFLTGKLSFAGIAQKVEEALAAIPAVQSPGLEEILAADEAARALVNR